MSWQWSTQLHKEFGAPKGAPYLHQKKIKLWNIF
jgi:hypothetical protein